MPERGSGRRQTFQDLLRRHRRRKIRVVGARILDSVAENLTHLP